MPKRAIDQRLAQIAAEGTVLRAGVDVGGPGGPDPVELRAGVDAVVLATGALRPRELDVPGRDAGRCPSGDGLPAAGEPGPDRRPAGDLHRRRRQACRHHRRRRHRRRLPRHRQPPGSGRRHPAGPQPPAAGGPGRRSEPVAAVAEGAPRRRPRTRRGWSSPGRGRRSPSSPDQHGRVRAVVTEEVQILRLDGQRVFRAVPDSRAEVPCELVLLAAGFVGTERGSLLDGLGVEVDGRSGHGPGARRLGDLGGGRLRLRRRHPRGQPRGVGDRRRTGLRGGRGHRADRKHAAAGPGAAGCPPALTGPLGGPARKRRTTVGSPARWRARTGPRAGGPDRRDECS